MLSLLPWPAAIFLGLALFLLGAGPVSAQAPARGHGAPAHDMELVGHDDRQGRHLADRANTGLHIVRLTGEAARSIVAP